MKKYSASNNNDNNNNGFSLFIWLEIFGIVGKDLLENIKQ